MWFDLIGKQAKQGRGVQFEWCVCMMLLASERSEQDTIRGVQIRAGVVYVYIYIYGGTCNK